MRIAVVLALVLIAPGLSAGCGPAHYDRPLVHGDGVDPQSLPGDDAGTGMVPMGDAAFVEPHDAGHATQPPDAWSRPGEDAWVAPQPDAWIAPQPDAYMMPSCPTYTTTVQPIYQMHCANCHTTGSDPHFGSSYTVANQSSSQCGSSMADCTIQLGSPGGSMAYRDPYGGFSTSEIATIEAWINCGRPR